MDVSRFTVASAVVALLGCVVAFVGPLALGAQPGIRGSVTLSAVVGAVFAGKNFLTIRERGVPSFAAGVMATVLGLWLIVAPLQYETVGAPLTALTQFGGMCLAAFSAYTALVAVEGFFGASGTADDDEGDRIGYS
jgi:phosphate/sulfate permease